VGPGGLVKTVGGSIRHHQQVLSGYDELFPRGGTLVEWLKSLDYSGITAAMERCALLPVVAKEYQSRLRSLVLGDLQQDIASFITLIEVELTKLDYYSDERVKRVIETEILPAIRDALFYHTQQRYRASVRLDETFESGLRFFRELQRDLKADWGWPDCWSGLLFLHARSHSEGS
jgi:hypothetical protein